MVNDSVFQKILPHLPFRSNNLIEQVDDYVIVNFKHFVNREYGSFGTHQLVHTLLSLKGKTFIFVITDGINSYFTGIRYIIDHVVSALKLKTSNCFIYGWENLYIPNTTFILEDTFALWTKAVYTKLNSLPIANSNFTNKFSALYGRHSIYRLKIIKYLFEKYKDVSLLSFVSEYTIWPYFENSIDFFQDDVEWYKANCPIVLDFKDSTFMVSWEESLSNIGNHYNSYFIEIVCETDTYSIFFTEKTLKNFWLGKPFILFAGPGSLATLHSKGFKTFSPFVDESYDKIDSAVERLDFIFKEIDRLNKLDLTKMCKEMESTFIHNREVFLSIIKNKK